MEESDLDGSAHDLSNRDSHILFPGCNVIRRVENSMEQPDQWSRWQCEGRVFPDAPRVYYSDSNLAEAHARDAGGGLIEQLDYSLGPTLSKINQQLKVADTFRSCLEKQFEVLQLELTDGQEGLKQSIKKCQEQIDAIYDAIDRVETVFMDLQEKYDSSQQSNTKSIGMATRLEEKHVRLLELVDNIREEQLRLGNEIARVQKRPVCSTDTATSLEETLFEQREIIFGTIHPILDTLKQVFENSDTKKEKDLDLMQEEIRADECRIKILESRIEKMGEESSFRFRIKELESQIEKMEDDAASNIRNLQDGLLRAMHMIQDLKEGFEPERHTSTASGTYLPSLSDELRYTSSPNSVVIIRTDAESHTGAHLRTVRSTMEHESFDPNTLTYFLILCMANQVLIVQLLASRSFLLARRRNAPEFKENAGCEYELCRFIYISAVWILRVIGKVQDAFGGPAPLVIHFDNAIRATSSALTRVQRSVTDLICSKFHMLSKKIRTTSTRGYIVTSKLIYSQSYRIRAVRDFKIMLIEPLKSGLRQNFKDWMTIFCVETFCHARSWEGYVFAVCVECVMEHLVGYITSWEWAHKELMPSSKVRRRLRNIYNR